MINQPISESNFIIVAMHHYDNPQCTKIEEFEEDLKRFLYLRKLFFRYHENGELRERLILNHIIVLHNLFGPACIEMLFFKIDKEFWDTLATFLVFLQLMPEMIPEFNLKLDSINLDKHVLQVLKEI